MSFKEFLEDLKFEGEKPATKGMILEVKIGSLLALIATAIFGYGLLKYTKLTNDLKREQLKNQYMLVALCNMPENQSACVAGFSDFEHDKD